MDISFIHIDWAGGLSSLKTIAFSSSTSAPSDKLLLSESDPDCERAELRGGSASSQRYLLDCCHRRDRRTARSLLIAEKAQETRTRSCTLMTSSEYTRCTLHVGLRLLYYTIDQHIRRSPSCPFHASASLLFSMRLAMITSVGRCLSLSDIHVSA